MFPSSNQQAPKNDFQFYRWALLNPVRLSNYARGLSEKNKLFRYALFFFKVDLFLILYCGLAHLLIFLGLTTEGLADFYHVNEFAEWQQLKSTSAQFWFLLNIRLKAFFPLLLIGFFTGLILGSLESIFFLFIRRKEKYKMLPSQAFYFDLVYGYRFLGAIGISLLFLTPFLTGYFHWAFLGFIYGLALAVYFGLTQKPGTKISKDRKSIIVAAIVAIWMMPLFAAAILMVTYLFFFYLINNLLVMHLIKKEKALEEC